jgi:chromosome partitioning protein
VKTITLFNNKGGVGKTSLVYHLAWMFSECGLNVIAADLDPQANLTTMFLDEDAVEELWMVDDSARTIHGALRGLISGTGDVRTPHVVDIRPQLGLIAGDLRLAELEDELSSNWSGCSDGKEKSFRITSAMWRALSQAAQERGADFVLIDAAPSIGALNRTVLISTDHVVVPLAPDLFSLRGLQNLGPRLRTWRQEWSERRPKSKTAGLDLPRGTMSPLGYIVMQHAVRLDRPVQAYAKWMKRIPHEYQSAVLGQLAPTTLTVEHDAHCLASLKHYRSLMPLAQEARKLMFLLRPADGAIGGHIAAVQACHGDFVRLVASIVDRIVENGSPDDSVGR